MTEKGFSHRKVLFRLEKDGEGYPQDDWESLWAYVTEKGLYCIDNIPFFVRGVSRGDLVGVRRQDDELIFESVEKYSQHSVLRVILFDKDRLNELTDRMVAFGCEWEGSHIEGLIAFDVPPKARFQDITDFLKKGEDVGLWEYEEASIRH